MKNKELIRLFNNTFNGTEKTIECQLLDSFGVWGKAKLIFSEFDFVKNYCNENKNIQIWKGSNKDIFILKDVKIAI